MMLGLLETSVCSFDVLGLKGLINLFLNLLKRVLFFLYDFPMKSFELHVWMNVLLFKEWVLKNIWIGFSFLALFMSLIEPVDDFLSSQL